MQIATNDILDHLLVSNKVKDASPFSRPCFHGMQFVNDNGSHIIM